ncbi:ribosomal RNA processing protein 1 homolog [Monomorium pharaonis]|uniref:ribosomal RNA processing protein 1 homolog n=1 Tax=Monomorium pharaonis TaxID=307658 RepID=UPI00063F779C|nr:ribosomal RNA processing protein 1 homolog [Monomorium pharaonis]
MVRKRGRHGDRVQSPRTNEMKTPNIGDKKPAEAKDKNKKALIIAQEIKIARLLANNDKRVRDKVLKRLNKWLTVRSQSSFVFTKADFMSLWKGLFYCMWMSDKMLIQEELAESLSKLVHCLNSKDTIVLYTSCALLTLAKEWFGIDQYRLDKFSMLVRRIVRQTFVICKNQLWNMEWVTEISQIFTQLFLEVKTAIGFNLHVTEIYLEELAKISNGNIPEDVVLEFIKPFAVYLITTNDERQIKHITQHVFRNLIFQSDIGMDYREKFQAWRAAGFPCARIDDMQKIEISDTEENSNSKDEQFSETENEIANEKPLDPRAGRVNVELPQIPFNAAKIVELLSTYKFHPSSTAKSRRQLMRLLYEFTELSQGRMPLGIKRIRKPNFEKKDVDSKKAALRLIQFEKDLLSDKPDKKRKRKNNVICDKISVNNSKNRTTSDRKSNIHIDADSENELTDTTTSTKANLQDVDAFPFKKRKKSDSTDKVNKKWKGEKNVKAIRDQVSTSNLKNGGISNLESNVHIDADSKSKLTDAIDKTYKKRKREKNVKAICDKVSTNNLKNGDTSNLESNVHIDADSKSKLTDATDKAHKKRKKEKNVKAICNQISTNNLKNGDILNLESDVHIDADSKSKLTDMTAITKANLQNIDASPFKIRKKSDSMYGISSTKSKIIENKKKLRLETSKKNKVTKIKTNKSKKSIADINVDCKTKTIIPESQIFNNTDQCIPISTISNKKVPLKEIKKSVAKKALSKNKIVHKEKPRKNESSGQIKKQINLNNSPMEKKKVIFGLSRNTAQHTSEYLQQVRKSPGIPFDANKKPLASVLKMNFIPSPLNPFYKK